MHAFPIHMHGGIHWTARICTGLHSHYFARRVDAVCARDGASAQAPAPCRAGSEPPPKIIISAVSGSKKAVRL